MTRLHTACFYFAGALCSSVLMAKCDAFSTNLVKPTSTSHLSQRLSSQLAATGKDSSGRFCKARELVKSLVEEEKCFSTESGASAFAGVCAVNVVYEDCYEPQPFVGKMVRDFATREFVP